MTSNPIVVTRKEFNLLKVLRFKKPKNFSFINEDNIKILNNGLDIKINKLFQKTSQSSHLKIPRLRIGTIVLRYIKVQMYIEKGMTGAIRAQGVTLIRGEYLVMKLSNKAFHSSRGKALGP
ncbi:19500_t:CDS:2 [Gigaspora margarita]|uniref:19500_t:CDS:1 n=1 Tax=Gigaspora margarita TaxID=4874 RepID=A0ABM8W146_GIGMA|nr:19500_t:CDS:2 [Gigaspora margarita]